MTKIFFTPGPSQIYPTVPKHLQNALNENILSISHRGQTFEDIFSGTVKGLRELLIIPQDYHVVFLASGTEAMERIIQNTVEVHSFHITAGAFGEKFYEIARDLGKKSVIYKIEIHQELSDIEIPEEAEVICITQNETSNGYCFPVEKIYELREKYPNKLIAVDIVSSVPYMDIDYNQVDMVFFSVQKGFGLPSGLGVLVISPAAYEKAVSLKKQGNIIGSFHSFPALVESGVKNQTPETPNILDLYLLRNVVQDMNSLGIKVIREQTEQKAKKLYDFLESSNTIKPFIEHPTNRSNTVIVAKGERLGELLQNLAQTGLVIGKGYGANKDNTIRIANFPSHSLRQVNNLIRAIGSSRELAPA